MIENIYPEEKYGGVLDEVHPFDLMQPLYLRTGKAIVFVSSLKLLYCESCGIYLWPNKICGSEPLYRHIYYHHKDESYDIHFIKSFAKSVRKIVEDTYAQPSISLSALDFNALDTRLPILDGFECTVPGCGFVSTYTKMRAHFSTHPDLDIHKHVRFCCMKLPFGRKRPYVKVDVPPPAEHIPSIPLSDQCYILTDVALGLQYCEACMVYILPPSFSQHSPLASHLYNNHREVQAGNLVQTVNSATARLRYHCHHDRPDPFQYDWGKVESRLPLKPAFKCRYCDFVGNARRVAKHCKETHADSGDHCLLPVMIKKPFTSPHFPVLAE